MQEEWLVYTLLPSCALRASVSLSVSVCKNLVIDIYLCSSLEECFCG
jgi:hypothetical protein